MNATQQVTSPLLVLASMYQAVSKKVKGTSQLVRYWLLMVLLLGTFFGPLAAESDYTRSTYAQATVVGKTLTERQHRSYMNPIFMMTVRLADGTKQTQELRFARYAEISLGDTVGVWVSKESRGLPAPLLEKARSLVLFLCLAGIFMTLAGIVTEYGYRAWKD